MEPSNVPGPAKLDWRQAVTHRVRSTVIGRAAEEPQDEADDTKGPEPTPH